MMNTSHVVLPRRLSVVRSTMHRFSRVVLVSEGVHLCGGRSENGARLTCKFGAAAGHLTYGVLSTFAKIMITRSLFFGAGPSC